MKIDGRGVNETNAVRTPNRIFHPLEKVVLEYIPLNLIWISSNDTRKFPLSYVILPFTVS